MPLPNRVVERATRDMGAPETGAARNGERS